MARFFSIGLSVINHMITPEQIAWRYWSRAQIFFTSVPASLQKFWCALVIQFVLLPSQLHICVDAVLVANHLLLLCHGHIFGILLLRLLFCLSRVLSLHHARWGLKPAPFLHERWWSWCLDFALSRVNGWDFPDVWGDKIHSLTISLFALASPGPHVSMLNWLWLTYSRCWFLFGFLVMELLEVCLHLLWKCLVANWCSHFIFLSRPVLDRFIGLRGVGGRRRPNCELWVIGGINVTPLARIWVVLAAAPIWKRLGGRWLNAWLAFFQRSTF